MVSITLGVFELVKNGQGLIRIQRRLLLQAIELAPGKREVKMCLMVVVWVCRCGVNCI